MRLHQKVFKMDDPHAELKLAGLRRMQRVATSLLCAMLVLLALSAAFKTAYPWLQWVQAFAGAATVGAIADWFAVVALFHHPLGLPIPHTAIVPSNKDRIGENLATFICANFLSTAQVLAKVRELDPARRLAAWLAEPLHAQGLAE